MERRPGPKRMVLDLAFDQHTGQVDTREIRGYILDEPVSLFVDILLLEDNVVQGNWVPDVQQWML